MWIVDRTVSFFSWIGRGIVYPFRCLGQWLGIVRPSATQREERRPNDPRLAQIEGDTDKNEAERMQREKVAEEERKKARERQAKQQAEEEKRKEEAEKAREEQNRRRRRQERERAEAEAAERQIAQQSVGLLAAIVGEVFREDEEEEEDKKEREQRKIQREQDREQAYGGGAIAEINSIINYAVGLLDPDILKEEALFHLYVALSSLIELQPLMQKDIQGIINQGVQRANSSVIAAYRHITCEIFIKTQWRTGVDPEDVPAFLIQMKEYLLNLLAQEAGNGYLAGLYSKRIEEEKSVEDNSISARVIKEILSDDQISLPLLNAIRLLNQPQSQPEEREENEREEASWCGGSSVKPNNFNSSKSQQQCGLAEPEKKARDDRAREARLAALEKNIKPAKTTDVSTSTAGNGLNSNVPSLT